ncbi:glyceraldehyde-3-phosphate dehydrogenase 2 [Paenibacillus sp. J31TS4]|uniref:type I glyceraldehyde-3-phosphate dehydrogenase n=1 Tax=Paenibacillus sp. J31TS4 TaxID=2807195 RepID=UPI001B25B18E|nr:type I glyceraldehyde-3-phosphate dehydrogenase [Paenibacillus sp. J31TS4]GIP39534.1 glyceraldehyde-3-phosphate dehydrogenase 2 [Paenibacillus sp. J31TS4]
MVQGVGISGMGRIGRLLIRHIFASEAPKLPLKAINCTHPVETLAHLLKYDSVHGKWGAELSYGEGLLTINGHPIRIVSEREPEKLGWSSLGVDLVIDATGKFNSREGALRHVAAGAERVLLTAPGRDMDLTVVMGVNEDRLDPERHKLMSAASCTTNCVSPVLAVLDEEFGVEAGWMTTVHSFTSDQNHLDNPHKDLRRARACTGSIVPTTTGVGKALKDVLPHLASRMQGTSLRVPTQDVSLIDLTVRLARPATADEVRGVFRAASQGKLAPYLGYSEEPLVSADYIGCPQSAVVDGLSIMASGDQVKVLAWYDNEWAYASRVVELGQLVKERVEQACKTPLTV